MSANQTAINIFRGCVARLQFCSKEEQEEFLKEYDSILERFDRAGLFPRRKPAPMFGRSKEENQLYLEELTKAMEKKKAWATAHPEEARQAALALLKRIGLGDACYEDT